jgi:DNA invertase Pin-like site-specific DNA recombinase
VLRACLDYLRPGDVLVVAELSRLGRSLDELLALVGGLRKGGVGFRSLHEAHGRPAPSNSTPSPASGSPTTR